MPNGNLGEDSPQTPQAASSRVALRRRWGFTVGGVVVWESDEVAMLENQIRSDQRKP